MRIYVKIGTMPAEYRRTYKPTNLPQIGEVFMLRPEAPHYPKVRVRCTDISDLGDVLLYFVERIWWIP